MLLCQPEGAEELLDHECVILFCDNERKPEVHVFIKHMKTGEIADHCFSVCISPADPVSATNVQMTYCLFGVWVI